MFSWWWFEFNQSDKQNWMQQLLPSSACPFRVELYFEVLIFVICLVWIYLQLWLRWLIFLISALHVLLHCSSALDTFMWWWLCLLWPIIWLIVWYGLIMMRLCPIDLYKWWFIIDHTINPIRYKQTTMQYYSHRYVGFELLSTTWFNPWSSLRLIWQHLIFAWVNVEL